MAQEFSNALPKRFLKKQSANIEKHLGFRLRERRRFLNLRQQDLAYALNMTMQQFSKYEKKGDRIPIRQLYKLAKITASFLALFLLRTGEANRISQRKADTRQSKR